MCYALKSTMRSTFLIFLVVCLHFQGKVSGLRNMAPWHINNVTKDVTTQMTKTWEFVKRNTIDTNSLPLPLPILQRFETALCRKFNITKDKIQDLSDSMLNKGMLENAFEQVFQHLPIVLSELFKDMAKIDNSFNMMIQYCSDYKTATKLYGINFIKNAVSSEPDSVISIIKKIGVFMKPYQKDSIQNAFSFIADIFKISYVNESFCDLNQSPQQILYNLYQHIALGQMKGYVTAHFAYSFLKFFAEDIFDMDVQNLQKTYELATEDGLKMVKSILENITRDLWRCDPVEHVEGETYERLTKLLQGYVENEQFLNKHGSCESECKEYSYTNLFAHDSYDHNIQKPCNGRILNCQNMEPEVEICKSDASSDRRYMYIHDGKSKLMGKEQQCKSQNQKTLTAFNYKLFWKCSYCFCFCDQSDLSTDKYLNLKSSVSDIKTNKVVTGLRIVKHNQIIHLQVQEAQLLPRLNVNLSSVAWKPVDNYSRTDLRIYNAQDFYTFNWNTRGLDLDDLEAEEGYILTGVRFKEIGSRVNFEIYTTKFDFDSGILDQADTKWISNSNQNRKKVKLILPDIPTNSRSRSLPDSFHDDQYIEFTYSDLVRDAAQTTVPYFDAQKVESIKPVPLSGAGIFHKGSRYSGGFIAPKIITFDVTKYLKPTFSPEQNN